MAHTSRTSVAEIADQIGSSLMPDNQQWTNRFTVKSQTSETVYVVAQRRTDSVWGCGCPGWRHHRRCKHVTDILKRLAALPPEALDLDPRVLAMLESARTAYLDLEGPKPVNVRMTADRMLDL